MKKFPYTPLQIAVHLYAWSGLVLLLFDYFTSNLSPNPIQDLEQRTGRHAITLLVLSLLCTPSTPSSNGASRSNAAARSVCMLSFMQPFMIIFVDLDFGLAWSSVIKEVVEKPRLIVGVIAFILLIPLALTSFDIWKKRLGKNWKRLHQLVYLIAPLVFLHYIWSKKGDLLSLQGEVLKPMIYGLIIGIFLIFRIPPIRKSTRLFFVDPPGSAQ
ncbi:protein-methionine-sulfoxide reductase heme-binding subunit MsrQ [Candidatus Villigracilis affinis]|uniref:sulfite oxidase heme-binding subunit YedZ n=1 Tax=Candidatus Villigracilis affinis TaxID=3140682 RepID=UPI002A1E4E4A|nr:sulfoxide reductase heme-binding subunit YedZ [Anaerolineales bacterium]